VRAAGASGDGIATVGSALSRAARESKLRNLPGQPRKISGSERGHDENAGFDSKEELLAENLMEDIIRDPGRRAELLGQSNVTVPVDPVEIEWKRRDHAVMRVRLSGREVQGEQNDFDACEVIAENITQLRELEDHLRRQAASDPLMGLANYRHLADVIDSEIKRSKRTNREFALLFFDVDRLKQINDRHRHMVGSQALCRLGNVLASCRRDIDTSARFGGDEFALVLPETDAAANRVARRICESIANDDTGPKFSVSFGVSGYPENADTVESLLCEADSRVYSRKLQKLLPAGPQPAALGS
jgi:diguanylate cyclase (GGDEF)-like protein